MNADHIIRMVLRMVMRKAVNGGIDMAVRRGKASEDMTEQEHQRAGQARQSVKRAGQAARMMRRMR